MHLSWTNVFKTPCYNLFYVRSFVGMNKLFILAALCNSTSSVSPSKLHLAIWIGGKPSSFINSIFFPSKSQEHGLIDSVWCQETTALLKFKFSRWFIINYFYNERQNLISNGIKNVQTLNEYERSNGKSELKAKEIILTSIVMKPDSPSLRIKFGGLGWIL